MKLNSYNNLLELFFDQYKKQDKNNIFLINLGNPKHKLSWEKTYLLVNHLSNQISKDIKFLNSDETKLIKSKVSCHE